MKIKDKFEDIIYFINKLFSTFICWFNLNVKNPYTWKLVYYSIFKTYPFDYAYIYIILKLKIQQSNYYFKHNCKFLDKDTINKITKYQDICISLIDIIGGDKHAYKLLDNGKWECLVNVNTKNYKRFLKYNINSLDDYIYKDDLYIEKARYLLSKILYEKSIEWWD